MFAADKMEILAVSEAVKDHWGRVFTDAGPTATVVHNGVDTAQFRPMRCPRKIPIHSGEPIVLGTACRLAPQKGLPYLLDAMSAVVARSPRLVRLDIAGEGSLREDLDAKVAALGLREHVRFLGFVADMPAFYRSIDAFVLSAVSDEGLPLVVLEAMASGLSVVATDVGGTKEALRDGVDGRIVPPRDVTALAKALLEIIASDSLCQSMGARARDHVCQSFSMEAQVEGVLAVYHEALAARGCPLSLQKTAKTAVHT
jgi:glycosyltransferase involved in cell wall biosynthesis